MSHARTSDIDNVGRATRHATFFEMLGNFSFGDYFKARTIQYACELLTDGYELDPARLWITVYLDDEAAGYWRELGIPAARIQRAGMADNYWSMVVAGQCGPCSDVCYDRGPVFGSDSGPTVNAERFLEILNAASMAPHRGRRPLTAAGGRCLPGQGMLVETMVLP